MKKYCVALCAGLIFLASCEALLPAALTIGGNLLATAAGNYDQRYGDEVRKLMGALDKRLKKSSDAAEPGVADASSPPPEEPEDAPAEDFPEESPADAEDPPTDEADDDPADQPSTTPLGLEVALLRQRDVAGRVVAEAINDGAILRQSAGDRFKVFLRTNQDCHVYVILIDGTGWVQPLFPSGASNLQNPVRAEQGCLLPQGEFAFGLDEHQGVETIYFVASREPRPDLERLLRDFAARERPRPRLGRSVQEPAILQRGVVRKRSGKTARVRTRSGDTVVSTTQVLADLRHADLVVTRWFQHR